MRRTLLAALLPLLVACAHRAAAGLGPSFRPDRDSGLRCVLRADFDGDERTDRAVVVRTSACAGEGCPRGIAIVLATGRVERLGLVPGTWARAELDGTAPVQEPIFQDFSFVEAWAVASLSGGSVAAGLDRPPGVSGLPDTPDALGAGLWMSSSDAAIIVYRTASGWRYVELGY